MALSPKSAAIMRNRGVAAICTMFCIVSYGDIFQTVKGRLRGRTGSALDHRSLSPEFEYRRGYIGRTFHL